MTLTPYNEKGTFTGLEKKYQRQKNLRQSLIHDKGFDHRDIHKAAEELRMEHKGSHDPSYEDSKKNK